MDLKWFMKLTPVIYNIYTGTLKQCIYTVYMYIYIHTAIYMVYIIYIYIYYAHRYIYGIYYIYIYIYIMHSKQNLSGILWETVARGRSIQTSFIIKYL